ncbi:MAG: tetratricopeptide repeat protein, partial [Lysobacteraceae bacterium]
PASLWVQPWRARQTQVADHVLFGPYPVEEDFDRLQRQGVTTIVSLLDPALPYENVLLAQERERARRHGMQVRNFPMASILGRSFGADYARNARAAAQAALDAKGVAYIHCYLGLHRAVNVQKLIAQSHATTRYAGSTGGTRPADTLALDHANFAFLDGDYARTLEDLAAIRAPGPAALDLAGWAHYRRGEIPAARAQFARALALAPGDREAQSGLAYCALRDNDLARAETGFAGILAARPDDPAAIEGLGHVRYRQGRADAARALFTRALALDPGNPEIRGMLDRLHVVVPPAAANASAAD